ncbi:uncharacterized protein LOC132551355 [Ylistrum balloti]|uniref:uncharacterized protein LOC132551355 n=1 Tax=Ylistrum balloti TaxID=509963 RepID=UPI0029058684|nr:uncharacterized protein LOC132551355 [Ylistrum balloti]
MAQLTVTCVILFSCYISLCSSVLELPPDGFWFNCGFDFCKFPAEYCRVITGQRPSCHACSQDECNALDTPSQCYTQCKELERGGPDTSTGNLMKGALQEGKAEENLTSSHSIASLIESNKWQWIAICILFLIVVLCLVSIAVSLVRIRNYKRELIRKNHAEGMQETKRSNPVKHGNTREDGGLQGVTVEPTSPNPPTEEVPLLPRHGNKQDKSTVLCQPSKQSGNVECQFSPKLMDDGSTGMGRHMEHSTDSSPDSDIEPIITQPIEDPKPSHKADCILLEQNNTQQSTVTSNDSSERRHSIDERETMIKTIFELTEDQDQVSLPGDIEMQVQNRPRSSSRFSNITPTASTAESSCSLSSDSTSRISTSDSGHYGTGNSSQNESVDLKNCVTPQRDINRQEVDV